MQTFITLASCAIGSSAVDKDCIKAPWNDPSARVLLFRPNVDNVRYLGFLKFIALSEFDIMIDRHTRKRDVYVMCKTLSCGPRYPRTDSLCDKVSQRVLKIQCTIVSGQDIE